jgi:hypothetical protein
MSHWDYEDDLHSQKIAHWGREEIRKVNDGLNALHSNMTPSLHDEGMLEILAELQVTKEITLDMEQTYFRYRKLRKFSSAMPQDSELISSPEKSTLIKGE